LGRQAHKTGAKGRGRALDKKAKHGKSHYGYKNHVNVDRAHKLVRRYHVTDAALHDSQAVDHLLMQGNTGSGVWADSAYRSEEMEAKLRARKLKSHIHRKGTVTADGAYDTRGCRTAIIDRQAAAIIPIRKTGRPWKEGCPAAAAETRSSAPQGIKAGHHGRAFRKRRTGYHARSRIEAKMRCCC